MSDGKFTKTTSWRNPEELKSLETKLGVEVHLMVEDPESVIESWLAVGAKRIIVHLQAIKNLQFVIDICESYGAEAVLSLDPSITLEKALPYIKSFNFFQVLSVFPGPSGQRFEEDSVTKIRALRERVPTATIEVDGGVNESTGRLAVDAGADVLVSGNYIFSSPDPKGAYDRLRALYDKSA
mgnify:CR=1 FL=1